MDPASSSFVQQKEQDRSNSVLSFTSSNSSQDRLAREIEGEELASSPTSSVNYLSSSSTKSPPPSSPEASPRLQSTKQILKMMELSNTTPSSLLTESVVLSDSDEKSSLDIQTDRGIKTPTRGTHRKQLLLLPPSSDDDEEAIDLTRLRIMTPTGNRRKKTRKSRSDRNDDEDDEESPNKKSRRSSTSSSPIRRGRKRDGSMTPESENNKSTSTRRRLRRKSRDSDKTNRSEFFGTGYTSMPTSGKVFRNLLILEESLRQQVIQQRAMRRKYLTFLSILCSIIAALSHHLFIMDNTPTGTLRVILQFCLVATITTLLLYHLSGEYQKTIVLPRKFLSLTNQGIRQLNVRLVKIKTPFVDKVTDFIREILLGIISFNLKVFHKLSPNSIQNKNSKIEVFLVTCQSQCQPRIGVTDVKLVLNARMFSTDIREGWEMYRSEFWVNEGIRRRNGMLAFFNDSEASKNVSLKRRKRRSLTPKKPRPVPATLSEQNLQRLAQGFDDSKIESDSNMRSESSSPLRSTTLVSD
ncbi:Sporulation-specific protein SPO7 [Candida viswanathii]|uniref:Sporulation-specific protein SPO7 n=1 Tax=Candida viswanathii TaxID=5486 RepID=A0A367XMN6_9ASCO|nr:Sporulation-specific protein SPO7 [Candida viswanathii]